MEKKREKKRKKGSNWTLVEGNENEIKSPYKVYVKVVLSAFLAIYHVLVTCISND